MFGPDLLVAPVLEQGATQREVYFPAGTSWVAVGTGAEIQGGQRQTVTAPLASVPVYVRAAAGAKLLPLFRGAQH